MTQHKLTAMIQIRASTADLKLIAKLKTTEHRTDTSDLIRYLIRDKAAKRGLVKSSAQLINLANTCGATP